MKPSKSRPVKGPGRSDDKPLLAMAGEIDTSLSSVGHVASDSPVSPDAEVSPLQAPTPLRSPTGVRRQADRLLWHQQQYRKRAQLVERRLKQLTDYLGITDHVTVALKTLSQQLFAETLDVLQQQLTIALQEVLEQPIQFRARPDFKRGAVTVEFSIDRDGHSEDVYRGQGGSVQNVLSVGLRMFALATLDASEHRRLLVLDEQDCWLRPELVPKLVKIVHQAGRELGFQVIMISHHDIGLFEHLADKIYQFQPDGDSVDVHLFRAGSASD